MNELCRCTIKSQTKVARPTRHGFRLVFILLLAFCLGTACTVHVDVAFDVAGTVTTRDGEPLSGVEVSLELSKPVYEAITPVRKARTVTDASGKFRFSYISGVPLSSQPLRV